MFQESWPSVPGILVKCSRNLGQVLQDFATIGLGIGAFYVRSMTIMLVQKETLAEFRYLEHGAFYSILSLSFIMFANSIWHVPEVITGLPGAGLIGLALWSSLRHNILALKT